MLIIGLSGGVATGKSTVSGLFKEHGIPVIDADLVARQGNFFKVKQHYHSEFFFCIYTSNWIYSFVKKFLLEAFGYSFVVKCRKVKFFSKLFSILIIFIIEMANVDIVLFSVVQPGFPAYNQLRQEFGGEYFDDENGGVLRRDKLGKLVFNNPAVSFE